MDAALVPDAAAKLFEEQWDGRLAAQVGTGTLELVTVAGSHSYGLQHEHRRAALCVGVELD